MATTRVNHAATSLSNGKVLVVGGLDNASLMLSSADLYDPITNTWAAVGSMASARAYHTATLLGGGKVLVTGGGSESDPIGTSAELSWRW